MSQRLTLVVVTPSLFETVSPDATAGLWGPATCGARGLELRPGMDLPGALGPISADTALCEETPRVSSLHGFHAHRHLPSWPLSSREAQEPLRGPEA